MNMHVHVDVHTHTEYTHTEYAGIQTNSVQGLEKARQRNIAEDETSAGLVCL
jgi:hypothetical protein